jgi:hypothetical protein
MVPPIGPANGQILLLLLLNINKIAFGGRYFILPPFYFNANMKKVFLIIIVTIACAKSYVFDPAKFFDKEEIDVLMQNIVTYVYKLPPKATLENRFSPIYAAYYKSNSTKFYFDSHFYSEKDNYHYYLIERPAGNDVNYKRTIGGRFKLRKGDFKPYAFEEIFNSPRLPDSVRIERGRFLFKELVKKGNIDEYLKMKHYIEWPDSSLIYNKITNNWEAPMLKTTAE